MDMANITERFGGGSKDVFGRIKIGDNTYIGENATILPGVTIERNCVIGAGSVVSRSIPDNTVAAGNSIRFYQHNGCLQNENAPSEFGHKRHAFENQGTCTFGVASPQRNQASASNAQITRLSPQRESP